MHDNEPIAFAYAEPKILTVSQINYYIKSLIDSDSSLNFVFATGEISNLKDHYSSGHIYLSLKDKTSVINAVMFKGNAINLKFKPENGMNIICRGRVSVYEATGQYQLYIEDMQPDGIGAFSIAYEQLKKKLSAEGLFAQEHKKPLPKLPKTVGVITSATGAVIQDISNVISRRFPYADIVLYPVLVQGAGAEAQLIEAVKTFSESKIADVVIIGRGGGSIEDLWAFNSENLAREIYNCKTPVISAVGHETDFTICDFVSDMRAPTPSAAAELAVPNKEDLLNQLQMNFFRISNSVESKIKKHTKEIQFQQNKLEILSPMNKIEKSEIHLNILQERLNNKIKNRYSKAEKEFENKLIEIEKLNPIKTLMRGYASVTKDSKSVASVSDLNKDDIIKIRFKDGSANAKIV